MYIMTIFIGLYFSNKSVNISFLRLLVKYVQYIRNMWFLLMIPPIRYTRNRQSSLTKVHTELMPCS